MFVEIPYIVRLCVSQGIVRLGDFKGQFYKSMHA